MNTLSITADEYSQFSRFLEEATGIMLGDNKEYLIISRLKGLMAESGISGFADLVNKVKTNAVLKQEIINAMTTNETSWFRDVNVYNCYERNILPDMVKSGKNDLRIWSAACSTGEEPYSISMCTQSYIDKTKSNVNVRVVGTDISKTVLDKAKAGYYKEFATTRGLSDDLKKKYFNQLGLYWEIAEPIKKRVSFQSVNLKVDFTTMGKFDIIFCRNVLIYFSTDLKQDVILRLSKQLKPNGVLVLGGSETMPNFNDNFVMHKHESIVYYQAKS